MQNLFQHLIIERHHTNPFYFWIFTFDFCLGVACGPGYSFIRLRALHTRPVSTTIPNANFTGCHAEPVETSGVGPAHHPSTSSGW